MILIFAFLKLKYVFPLAFFVYLFVLGFLQFEYTMPQCSFGGVLSCCPLNFLDLGLVVSLMWELLDH